MPRLWKLGRVRVNPDTKDRNCKKKNHEWAKKKCTKSELCSPYSTHLPFVDRKLLESPGLEMALGQLNPSPGVGLSSGFSLSMHMRTHAHTSAYAHMHAWPMEFTHYSRHTFRGG